MRRVLTIQSKGAWRAAVACALAACGLARGQDESPLGATPPVQDLAGVYRDAYANPNSVATPEGLQRQASQATLQQGVWDNVRRYKFYVGGDYMRWTRSHEPNLALTRVSNDIFWDDTAQQAQGALNAEGSPARVGGVLQNGQPVALFPTVVDAETPLRSATLNPNDAIAQENVNEFLVPNAVRMSTNQFNYNKNLSGYRPKIGIELPNGDRVEFSYFKQQQFNGGQLIDNVSGAAFLTKQISAGLDNPFDPTIDKPIGNNVGETRFGFFRWGFLRAPFTIPVDYTVEKPTNGIPYQTLLAFRGEDVRGNFGPLPLPLFPHFPYNELPQPTAGKGPFSPTNPLLPLLSIVDPNGIRSRDIPRKPTSNDFPQMGSFIFRNGEIAIANLSSDIQGGELLWRHKIFNEGEFHWNIEMLGGVRYVNSKESFSYFFGDLYGFSRSTTNTATPNVPQPPTFLPNDFLGAGASGQPAEETQVTINRRVSNNLLGPQIGLDARFPFLNYFEVDLMTKGGFMANFASTGSDVFRGDGLPLVNYTKSNMLSSGIVEGQFGVNYFPHPNVKIKAGWEYMWLIGIATAIGNSNIDLSQLNRPSNHDQIFFSGFYSGVEVTF